MMIYSLMRINRATNFRIIQREKMKSHPRQKHCIRKWSKFITIGSRSETMEYLQK